MDAKSVILISATHCRCEKSEISESFLWTLRAVGLSLTFRLSVTFHACSSITGAHQCATTEGFLPLLVQSV